MANEKSVTNEGVPQELDLGHVEPPSEESMNSLDEAMRAAGIDDGIKFPEESRSVAKETAIEPEQEVPAPSDEKPLDPNQPADSQTAAPEAKTEPPEGGYDSVDLDTIQPPQDISPRNLVNFNKLRDMAKHFKTQAEILPQLQQRLQELERRNVQVPQDVAKELEELRTFRRVFDTENDPEFKKQFDGKIESLDNDVLSILMKNGLPEDTAKQIKQVGMDKISPKWWEETILSKLTFVDRERVQKRLAERADTIDQRHQEIQKFQQDRESFVQREQQERVERFNKTEEEIYGHVEQLTENVPWARYQELPEGATPEQIKQIEAHNASVEELERQFVHALFPETSQARAEVAAAAVASTKLAASVQDLSTRLTDANSRAEKFQKELEAIRAAGRPPSARQTGTRAPASSERPDPLKMSDEDAIEQGLMAAESAL
jgi:hypothetical protein